MELPFGGAYIFQERRSQGVSQVAAALQAAALEACPEEDARVLELGSGCGIVSIMLALQRPRWQIDALEIQPKLHQLAVDNASLCGVEVAFQLADLRDFQAEQAYQLIISNPPWRKRGSGLPSPHPSREASRSELFCNMADVLACVKRNLSPAGAALLVYPASRERELAATAQNTLLDIISALAVTGHKEHTIYRFSHKGKPQ